MPIEEIINVSLLKETGYSTWFNFIINMTGSTCSKGKCTYTYKHAQGDKKEIQLEIGNRLLERLAFEEAKLNLPVINMPSFAAFDQLPNDNKIWIDNRIYLFDVVVHNKNGEVFLKRIQYYRTEIEKLQSWEARYGQEWSYLEKRNEDTCG